MNSLNLKQAVDLKKKSSLELCDLWVECLINERICERQKNPPFLLRLGGLFLLCFLMGYFQGILLLPFSSFKSSLSLIFIKVTRAATKFLLDFKEFFYETLRLLKQTGRGGKTEG